LTNKKNSPTKTKLKQQKRDGRGGKLFTYFLGKDNGFQGRGAARVTAP